MSMLTNVIVLNLKLNTPAYSSKDIRTNLDLIVVLVGVI